METSLRLFGPFQTYITYFHGILCKYIFQYPIFNNNLLILHMDVWIMFHKVEILVYIQQNFPCQSFCTNSKEKFVSFATSLLKNDIKTFAQFEQDMPLEVMTISVASIGSCDFDFELSIRLQKAWEHIDQPVKKDWIKKKSREVVQTMTAGGIIIRKLQPEKIAGANQGNGSPAHLWHADNGGGNRKYQWNSSSSNMVAVWYNLKQADRDEVKGKTNCYLGLWLQGLCLELMTAIEESDKNWLPTKIYTPGDVFNSSLSNM